MSLRRGTDLLRRMVDAGFGLYARTRAKRIDRTDLAAAQQRTLRRLVARAAATRFGRAHDFGRIRTVRDFQARVPLRHYEDFWRDYWAPAYPGLRNATWPGEAPFLALSSGTTTATTKHIPVTPEMLRSNGRAAATALAWLRIAHPEIRPFTGKLFFLGGSTTLEPPRSELVSDDASSSPSTVLAGDLSGIAAATASPLLQPFTFPPRDLALLGDWERKLDETARRSLDTNITMVSGVPSWLLVLFERLRQITGRSTISECWPNLQVLIHGGTAFDGYRRAFRELLGDDRIRFLEVCPASEGFVAAEDPRFGLLRLIPDHGVFYEFVAVSELGGMNPTRHTAAEVEPGVQYAVVLTTCAGLWSYVLGDTVCFESRDPPLLRFTGRTRQCLSAFGEHLIGEELERAVARAAERTGATVVDFHVGPVFPGAAATVGRHRCFVEFDVTPTDAKTFTTTFDAELSAMNEDYRAHRAGDLTIGPPELIVVPRGGFAGWMKDRGKLGGQHKVPRADAGGVVGEELYRRFCRSEPVVAAREESAP
jgi:hypothetical protein